MERLYHRFFGALPIRTVQTDEDLHLLSAEELRLVRRTEYWAMAGAVLVELLAYLMVFLPIYRFPAVFDAGPTPLGGPFGGLALPFDAVRDGWMLLVTGVELYVLLLLNLAAVHGIAVATGYLKREERARETSGLIRIALARQSLGQRDYGIDPFEGMRPWVLYGFLLFNRLKGLIGSALVRAALTNLFGREMLRIYLDFSGMPIYMAINVYTTRAILRNARVVVMGQTSIEIVRRRLPKPALSAWERGLVYDSLQFIAVHKRDFHPNHLFLTRSVLEHFDIPAETRHALPEDYTAKLTSARPQVADLCRLIIVLGFVLDGRLSWRERAELERLRKRGVLDLDFATLEAYRRNFVDGQGMGEVTARYLGGTQESH